MPPLTVWDHAARHSTRLGFFINIFGGHKSFLWGHWYPCIGFLVMSPLGFKARVGSLICTSWRHHSVRPGRCSTDWAMLARLWNETLDVFSHVCLSVSHSVSMSVHAGGIPMWPLPTWDIYQLQAQPPPTLTMQGSPRTCSNLFTWDLTIQGLPRHVQTYSLEPYNAGTPKKTCSKGGGWPSTERSSSSVVILMIAWWH